MTIPTTPPCSFLALGDSYTIGEGVAPDERWPAQLVRRLRSRGREIDEPAIVATTGWTTDELSAAMDATTFAPPYALVTLLIGVNNQYRGRGLDNYRVEFEPLLQRAIALAGGREGAVIVVSIPDWGVTPFADRQGREQAVVGAEIDAFNEAAREIAAQHGVAYADVTAESRATGADPTMLVADGLHPSAAQYALWADLILPMAESSLAEWGHIRAA